MKKGISLISLIITIIVVIILAAIAIFSGFGSIEYANLAKFTGEFSDYEAAVQNEYIIRKQNYAINGNPKSDKEIFEEMAGGAEGDINPEVAAKIGVGRAFAITNTIKGYAPDKFGRAYITTEGRVYLDPADAFPYNSDDGLKRYASSNIILDGEVAETEPEGKTLSSLAIGDFVYFFGAGTTSTVTIPAAKIGEANDVTVSTSMQPYWRVWKKSGGNVELMLFGDVKQFSMPNTTAFSNGAEILNEIAGACVVNSSFGTTKQDGRILTLEELEQLYAENPDIYEDMIRVNTNWSSIWMIKDATKELYNITPSYYGEPAYYKMSSGNTGSYYIKPIVKLSGNIKIDESNPSYDGQTKNNAWRLQEPNN